ncbi:MAG: hypothetical protein R2737_13950 [Candidatus Nanopelagicales bacterium]
MTERLSLVLGSDEPDRLHAAAQLVAGAAAAGVETDVLLVHSGLAAFLSSAVDAPVPAVAGVGGGPGDLVTRRLADPDVPRWAEVLREAREIGVVHVHACKSSLALLDASLDDLDPMVDDAVSVATFMARYDGAHAMYV